MVSFIDKYINVVGTYSTGGNIMRIVRPYGESRVVKNASEKLDRHLIRNTIGREQENVEEFARSHDELVIAQWISTIDKIASKPSGTTGATERQRQFRDRLGKSALEYMRRENVLQGLSGDRASYLLELWEFKTHPYGKRRYRARFVKGEEIPEPRPEGRLFQRFAGALEPENADVDAIVRQIHTHLYKGEFRASEDLRPKPDGRIGLRARSIRKNTLKRKKIGFDHDGEGLAWSRDDEAAYAAAGNVASEIRDLAIEREQPGGRKRAQRVGVDIAGKALYDHWARVFQEDGRVLSMNQAEEDVRFNGMVHLHKAVKDAYARLLKRHGKDRPEHRKDRAARTQRRVSTLLPSDMPTLFKLMRNQRRNRSLSDLVRLGKVIHYTATFVPPTDDYPDGGMIWPTSVETSRYWTSAGQSEIKRTEAFVRTWRNAIAQASRTLKDWADHDDRWASIQNPDKRDILVAHAQVGANILIDADRFDLKLDLLFGQRKSQLPSDIDTRHVLLRQTISDCYDLRNLIYHFKGRERFVAGLESLGQQSADDISGCDQAIWEADCQGQHDVLIATLDGAHLKHFAKEHQAAHLVDRLSVSRDGHLPLPRFSRLLTRAKEAWQREKQDKPNLPDPANRVDLEAPARRCQYVTLKLLYERAFRSWLEDQPNKKLTSWIDKAVARSTRTAKSMNARKGETGYGVIVSRAESLPRPGPSDGIDTFFFDLTAATASEMRVQRGYQSDAESARKQASFIEDLKCDVIALAFSNFLANEGFGWLQEMDTSRPLRDEAAFSLGDLKTTPPNLSAHNWQYRLYFLLHLIPVDEVGRLLHQLARWEITSREENAYPQEEKDRLAALRRCLTLYLDMHDAKFSGGSTLAGCQEFVGLFQNIEAFDAVFPPGEVENDSRVPRRGLREIARFGNLTTLRALFDKAPITMDEINAVNAMERVSVDGKSEIARLQARREDLHLEWTRRKRDGGLPSDQVMQYIKLIGKISKHRQLSNRINLIDHARAHSLMMTVIGRMVDYVGLFERDLYFATLAIVHDLGTTPGDIFKSRGYERLQQGRILDALTRIQADTPDKQANKAKLRARIAEHFTDVCDKGNEIRRIRNHIAHLEMLGPDREPDFTGLVNELRQVMAFDRKLKNAVSQSFRELLQREGFDLTWRMDGETNPHKLFDARVLVKSATHLGGQKLSERHAKPGKRRPDTHIIHEALHSQELVTVIAGLFNGRVDDVSDVTSLDLGTIDFQAIDRDIERKLQRKNKGDNKQRPAQQKNKRRKNHNTTRDRNQT